MKKWVISAIVYLLVVIGAYTAYDKFSDKDVDHSETNSHETMANTEGHGHKEKEGGHEHEGGEVKTSEVETTFLYKDGKITIVLKDANGKPVDDLVVNHEKLLHLIIVDEHLDQYLHLHPEKVGAGKFELSQELLDGAYKAFIDIKPEKLNYHVTPVAFTVGEQQDSHSHNQLKVDENFVKTIDGKTAEMEVSSFEAKRSVILSFKVDETSLEPYLGAAGHVVILNETANEYLHVHPQNETKPVFETQFDQPGKYKIWAEFKQDGKVRVFSYVIEIK
ncbi:hypothetical protein QE429_003073 [Bacillus sp. SORGH_AS 510]|uniref:hypothetical protein n=1 Tax=Bacillus sp. SORGH_AS_0510 TaxID=3041771 RepID=UPI002786870F|nr:hypothetical protein [Bacillus sp. SORGH_AS_0510]MDQ1146246.1 hypothetical protein [Bacillus sp. SORGH_AS_0510]